MKEQKQQQAIQAEQALDEFKGQVEKNQARIYDDMKQQVYTIGDSLCLSSNFSAYMVDFVLNVNEDFQICLISLTYRALSLNLIDS